MILRCALAAGIGFCQVFLIVFQTRQLAAGKRGLPIFLASIGISGIWVGGVVSIAAHPITAPFYVLAAACGTVTAAGVPVGRTRRIVPRPHLLLQSLRDRKRKP
jgi:hypothetical protein